MKNFLFVSLVCNAVFFQFIVYYLKCKMLVMNFVYEWQKIRKQGNHIDPMTIYVLWSSLPLSYIMNVNES